MSLFLKIPKKNMDNEESANLIEKTSLKSEIIANESRIKYVRAAADKDYQDFLRSLDNFSSSEDSSYNNKIIESILNMQNEAKTEAIDVTMLITGNYMIKTQLSEYEAENEKYKAEMRALRQDNYFV